MKHPILANYPGNVEEIDWVYLDKDNYIEIENILTNGVKFFDPFLVDNFYPEEMFSELVKICNNYDLKNIDFSHQMNKWEEPIRIPQKFTDFAVQKVKDLLGTDDVIPAYHMYAHHQITSEGRVPKLPLHIDWSPGSYMVDLQIGGNRDWGFVARYENFVCKPNQAVICQPQFDYHYRPTWASNDEKEYYQAIFFHLINRDHWLLSKETGIPKRNEDLELKYEFGEKFRETETFKAFQDQRRYIFDRIYLKNAEELINSGELPKIPWDEIPTEEDATIHQRKGVIPKIKESNA